MQDLQVWWLHLSRPPSEHGLKSQSTVDKACKTLKLVFVAHTATAQHGIPIKNMHEACTTCTGTSI